MTERYPGQEARGISRLPLCSSASYKNRGLSHVGQAPVLRFEGRRSSHLFLDICQAVERLVQRLILLGKVDADDIVDISMKKEVPGTQATPTLWVISSQNSTSLWPGFM